MASKAHDCRGAVEREREYAERRERDGAGARCFAEWKNVGFWLKKRAIRRAVAEFGRAGDGEGAGGGVPTVAKYILNP